MKHKFQVGKLIEKIIENILIIFLLFMVVLVFINASMRYILHTNILNSEELARFSFIWMCLLGCIVTHMKKGHMRVTFVTDMLPKKAEKVVTALARLVTAGALVYLCWGSVLYIKTSSGFMNPGVPLNYGIIMSVVLIMAAGMLLVDIVDFVKFILRYIKPVSPAAEDAGEKP